MADLTWNIYLDAEIGAVSRLPKAGTSLEHPYVYDAAARDMLSMAERGLIEVVEIRPASASASASATAAAANATIDLIDDLRFRRLR